MKTIITITTIVVLSLYAQLLKAQETDKANTIELLVQEKENITNAEKAALKKEVEAINEKLAKTEITVEEAQRQKEAVAQKRALNIENLHAIIDNKIELLDRNGAEYSTSMKGEGKLEIGIGAEDKENGDILFGMKINTGKEKKIKYDRRTYSNLVVAFGLNNALLDGQSLDDSNYKVAGSRFFELGWVWSTRVFKNSNFLRLKYGVSYQSNGLKPTDNRYFVENNNQTQLEEFRVELDKSKFRMDNIVAPLHLEFGPSKVKETENSIRYSTARKFKIGLGGYVGVNVSTRQKLKYKENGDEIKDKIKRDYNTTDVIYGLSSYIGFGDMSIYAKYDISPMFRNAEIDQNNVSLGLRFDL
ncbi:coiled-coil domain-containing protein [Aquimarina mytili]|uniref:Outer membrane protein beta-barrel domain-containing protein n=1 Tax=Aquimarina mytili TaxID=874423 RepID=A0A936ZSG3_9FLAO|nr:hypothetical protein [Aquimarina mytili]MBL0683467.1 hypothetical protein [Aquimarina mytili]